MSKFTKGPWYVMNNKKNGDSGELISSNGMGVVCRCFSNAGEGKEPEEKEANAHLIAAAPDLYGALNALYTEWDDTYDGEPMNMELFKAYELARKALAKARGES